MVKPGLPQGEDHHPHLWWGASVTHRAQVSIKTFAQPLQRKPEGLGASPSGENNADSQAPGAFHASSHRQLVPRPERGGANVAPFYRWGDRVSVPCPRSLSLSVADLGLEPR